MDDRYLFSKQGGGQEVKVLKRAIEAEHSKKKAGYSF